MNLSLQKGHCLSLCQMRPLWWLYNIYVTVHEWMVAPVNRLYINVRYTPFNMNSQETYEIPDRVSVSLKHRLPATFRSTAELTATLTYKLYFKGSCKRVMAWFYISHGLTLWKVIRFLFVTHAEGENLHNAPVGSTRVALWPLKLEGTEKLRNKKKYGPFMATKWITANYIAAIKAFCQPWGRRRSLKEWHLDLRL
jgi:hypothetical protein